MKSFLAAVLAVAGISFGASVLLESYQRTTDQAYAGPGTRVDLDKRLSGAPKS